MSSLQLQELQALEKVAIKNQMAMAVLLRKLEDKRGDSAGQLEGMQVTWDYSAHATYPIIGLRHKTTLRTESA